MPRAMQRDLFGGVALAGDVVDHLTAVLEDYPAARDSTALALALYYWDYGGASRLGCTREAWVAWYAQAKNPKTAYNWLQRIQKARLDLAPSAAEQARRVAKSRRGAVR
jgi:hypothetical protein